MDLEKIYQRRFEGETEPRKKIWRALCGFFQKYIPQEAVVLDLGAGYCEFINNIVAKKKIALDINMDTKKFANPDVEVIASDYREMKGLKGDFCDVVFVSNFFEHITKEDIVRTLKEVYRILNKGGKLLILQPNIRFCYKDY